MAAVRGAEAPSVTIFSAPVRSQGSVVPTSLRFVRGGRAAQE